MMSNTRDDKLVECFKIKTCLHWFLNSDQAQLSHIFPQHAKVSKTVCMICAICKMRVCLVGKAPGRVIDSQTIDPANVLFNKPLKANGPLWQKLERRLNSKDKN